MHLVFPYISLPVHELSPKEFQKSIKQGMLFGLLLVIAVLISNIYFMVNKQQVMVYKIQLDNNQIFNQLVVKSLEDNKLSFT